MHARIALCPGDGIGPEIVDEARRVLDAVAAAGGHDLTYGEHLIGGAAIDAAGTALPADTLAACAAADAVLLGAVGGPRWDDPQAKVRPEQGLLALRQGLGLWANLRPVAPYPCLSEQSSLRPERLAGVDLLVIRELTGGLYFGTPKERTTGPDGRRAVDTLVYSEHEIRRVVALAFRVAAGRRGKVTSIDKANVLESSRLWRQVTVEVAADHPGIALDHMLVDAAAMRLITHPAQFDVIVTENMFGDILTDEAAVLAGSIGLLPSASLGDGRRGLYEPIHGSAPDLAGQGVANPVGTILSAAMLLRHSLGLDGEARAVERAVDQALRDGCRTRDLGGALSTAAMGAAIRERLAVDVGAASAAAGSR
ncbi:MAG: 3-isopropylmalate dehydrogenase [Kofleriaceae bacterium]|nr:3-isopropylmalate dehydrogenase [Kofleriaceae bacterium]MCL4223392.1 3-isopropylmalate dehydrogenase [Myxococcales bacterium]